MTHESENNVIDEAERPDHHKHEWQKCYGRRREKKKKHECYNPIRESPHHIDNICSTKKQSNTIPRCHPEKKYDAECEKNWEHIIHINKETRIYDFFTQTKIQIKNDSVIPSEVKRSVGIHVSVF